MVGRFINLNRLSAETGLAKSWLKAEAEAGRIPSIRQGRSLMFDLDAVNAALSQRQGTRTMNTTASGLLGIDAVARELDIDSLAVHRLIALGRFKPGRIGKGGPLRFDPAELAKYVMGGAPDRVMPDIAGVWLADRHTRNATSFAGAIVDAAEDQVFDDHPGRDVVDLNVTPKIASVIASPVPTTFMTTAMASELRAFADWREIFVASRLIALARKPAESLDTPRRLAPPVEKLYMNGATAFSRVLANADAAFREGAITFRKDYPSEDGREAIAGQGRTVTYRLSHTKLLGGKTLSRVRALVF